MTTIHTRCPACAEEVDLEPTEAALLHGSTAFYGFTCPSCEAPVLKPADERVIGLLETAGVAPDGPAERLGPLHPECPAPGPALTRDDLLALHELLADDDWLARLLESR